MKQRQLHWQGANVAAGKATAGRQWEKGSLARLLPSAVQALLNVVAAILLFGRRRDPVAALLSIAMLCLNSYGLGERAFYELGLFKLQLVGAFTGFSLLLLGLFAFPAGRFVPRWTAAAAALVPWWAVFGFFFNDSQRGLIGFSFLGLLLLALAAIWLRYRGYASDAERQQVRWFMLGLAGTAVFTLLQLCCRFVIQTELDAATWLTNLSYLFALLATAAFSAGLVISLLKFRLYDADAVIERSVTFGVLTVGLLGIFAGSEKIIEVLGEEYFGDRLGALAGGLGAAVAAVMISPLHHRITDWAEHRFQRNLRRLRLQLPLIVGDLRETSRVERLAEVVLDELAIGLRSRCAALLVGDHVLAARGTEPDEVESWRRGWVKSDLVGPDCDPHDPHFALRLPLDAVGHGRVGWILLGPRPDGSFYGKDERETLGEIADPIARALDISAERDAERSATRAAMDELKERLSVLESRLSDLPAPAR